ncbi:response regulator transcription factor [Novosphingobium sp. 9U]|uniref:LuxR C-terminal-related transcriptional regulator n=1 Tax=Novosphingobium sp. 9U TaxID=2653158 RepID=UPI0012F221BF|nr:response regulator transcription factor [Novosphingobium sp. 9U]VWX54957.1 putative Glycerol metabolism activator [Novosphingobium sp. 9U]
MESVKALIADPLPLLREGLAPAMRYALPGCTVLSAGTLAEAEALAGTRGRIAMAVLDPELPDAKGLSALLRLQYRLPRVPIALLVAPRARALVGTARAMGAAGVLLKSAKVDEIAEDLRSIANGRSVFPPHSVPSQAASIREILGQLSDAQRRVLFALADGRANKMIAHNLGVSEATVKAHLTAIFRQLGVTNRMEAMLALQPILGELVA